MSGFDGHIHPVNPSISGAFFDSRQQGVDGGRLPPDERLDCPVTPIPHPAFDLHQPGLAIDKGAEPHPLDPTVDAESMPEHPSVFRDLALGPGVTLAEMLDATGSTK